MGSESEGGQPIGFPQLLEGEEEGEAPGRHAGVGEGEPPPQRESPFLLHDGGEAVQG